MPPNEPAPTAPFTDEDRQELEMLADDYDAVPNQLDGRLIARAASYITYLEGALEAADELALVIDREGIIRIALADELDAYQSARAALPTSKEDAG